MSAAVDTSSITRQIWQRLVTQGDRNADNRLDKAELDAVQADTKTKTDMAAIISAYDTDGDGGLTADELPSAPLGTMTFGALLDYQTYCASDVAGRAADDARIVDAMFARADVDGDGVLSKSEWDAEKAMRQTRWLMGEAQDDDPVFIVRMGANEEALRREDIAGGRAMRLKVTPIPWDQLPADVREEIEAHRKALAEYRKTHPAPTPLTPEERRQQVTAKLLSTPLDTSYMTRLLAQLSASIAASRAEDLPV